VRRGGLMALAALLAGFSPFRAEERNVRDGNERLASGDPAAALSRYDEAEKAAGAHAEIEYDRGGALYRLGRRAEARQAWRRSQGRAPGALSSRASQNIGTALASEGDREGAIAAFTEALRQDPRNEDARFNLEVLLRRKEEQQQQQQQQGPGHEEGEAQSQAGRESPPPGQQPRQRPPRERAPEDGGAREGADQSQGGRSGAEGAGGEMSRQDAERILDAFRAQDRIAPPPGGERRRGWRTDGDRDW
jgi:Ca-activated chloride channel homolog